MYNLNANKVGTATDTLYTFTNANSTTYNGFEVSANARQQAVDVRRLHVGERRRAATATPTATGCRTSPPTSARDNPNALRFCDAIPPFRTTVKLSAAYQLPYDFQLSGTFLAIPGRPSMPTTPSMRRSPAGRSSLDRRRHDAERQPDPAEHGVPRLPPAVRHAGREDLAVQPYRIQLFADIFNVLNAGTVTRVNETYGSVPATNAWFRPLSILDGRTSASACS